MTRIFLAAAFLALVARATVFSEPDSTEAFVSFALFWACAAGSFVGYITS